jgi:hypothetical protein
MDNFESTQPGREDPRSSGESEGCPLGETVEDGNDRKRTVFVAHNAQTQLIPGLMNGAGIMTVQKWDSTKRARGWTLTSANFTLDRGRPFGAMWYRHDDDQRIARVGVRWNHDVEQLEALCLHPNEARLADDVDNLEAAALERDARSRVGTLVASNAQIGSFISSARESENAILAASGLGLKRLDD